MDKEKLFGELVKTYRRSHHKSEVLFKKAGQYLVRGGSHNLRMYDPYPFYAVGGTGAHISDVDGNTYVDYWQGHFANVLGHNPKIVTEALGEYFNRGNGLLTGFPDEHQAELAALILKQFRTDKIRFTTSGTLASMYAIMLAKSFTGRELVMKVGGGWHGAQPFALKGISTYTHGLESVESAGLPQKIGSSIIMTRFNDIEDLEDKFRKFGDKTACLIVEPFIGAGGLIFGRKDYICRARELSHRYGSVLILDEVISGFRFHPGGIQTLYEVEPDMTVLGKAIGGGMPASALAGKERIMQLCGPAAPAEARVKFEGGTFSAHPSAMLAGLIYVKYLIENADDVYPKIGRLGNLVRRRIEEIFKDYGFHVKCSGLDTEVVRESSIVGVHFLHEDLDRVESPEHVWNSSLSDFEIREKHFKLAMINEGFNVFHGFGSISSAHQESDILLTLEAVEKTARLFSRYR